MGIAAFDYPGYRETFLIKSDLKPMILKRYGIYASQKEIDAVYRSCYCGWILTGGAGVLQYKHTPTYSVYRLIALLKKG